MEREKVDFTGAMQMMLVTLYGKAMESGFPDSLLKDRFAAEAVRWIDYDFPSLKVDSNMASGLAIRAKAMDEWVSGFLTRNPAATVVHLGCGMDTRVFRIDPPGEVEWFDVDYPEVVALRRRLYPARVHYHLVASPAAEFGWIEEVPRGPAVIVAEGLTPYLRPQEGLRLFSRLVAHCGQGELVCDVYGGFALKMMRLTPYFRRSGAELHWAIEDPRELEKEIPGLRLVEAAPAYKPEDAARMTWASRPFIYLWNVVPALRKTGRMLRFRF